MGSLPCQSCFVPGQVLWKNEDGSVAVGTGDSGVLLLGEVEKTHRKPCRAGEIVQSLRERFGGVNEESRFVAEVLQPTRTHLGFVLDDEVVGLLSRMRNVEKRLTEIESALRRLGAG